MKLKHLIPRSLRPSRTSASIASQVRSIQNDVCEAKMLSGRLLSQQIQQLGRLEKIADAEFKVFSQFGDDGIIQYLINYLNVQPTTFVEFGVENYLEANTRFLLMNNNWRGLILDGNDVQIEAVKKEVIYWRNDLTAVSAFIDRENINELIQNGGIEGDLGLLSVDIDGNDYWVWDKITCVEPTIVVAEYNSVFGADRAVTVPYDPAFVRNQKHYSNLYFGASLKALCLLADEKGYEFVGCNSNGNNAYFVLRERMRDLVPLSAKEGFVESRFRESRDQHGELTYIRGPERISVIRDLPLIDIESNQQIMAGDVNQSRANYREAS